MAAPAHYIRTIHTSFTAAHPHSSSAAAWATATASSQYLNQFNHHHHHHNTHTANPNIISQPRAPGGSGAHGGYTSISTHNTHMYTHHLRDLTHSPAGHRQQSPPPSGMMMAQQGQYIPQNPRKSITATSDVNPRSTPSAPRSRRRSVSIRMPPTYKFDPFADEPITSEVQTASPSPHVAVQPAEVDTQLQLLHTAEAPYTIQIPAAAQTDIQLYTPPRPASNPSVSLPPSRSPSPSYTSRPLSPRAPSFTPMQKAPPPNLSKVVASILLNRVHAVGKPMRRRVAPSLAAKGQGRDYVKSCLSSVISVEA